MGNVLWRRSKIGASKTTLNEEEGPDKLEGIAVAVLNFPGNED
jgi:hypothetical protein